MSIRKFILKTQAFLWLLLLALGIFITGSARHALDTADLARMARLETTHLQSILAGVVDLEQGMSGYVITGDVSFLDPFNAALQELPGHWAELRELSGDHAHQGLEEHTRHLDTAERLLQEWQQTVGLAAIKARAQNNLDIAQAVALQKQGKQISDRLRAELRAHQAIEIQKLQQRERSAQAALQRMLWLTALGLLGAVLISVATSAHVSAQLSRAFNALISATRRVADGDVHARVHGSHLREAQQLADTFHVMTAKLDASQRALQHQNAELARRNQEMQLLNELSDRMQACASPSESCQPLSELLPRLFPGSSGEVTLPGDAGKGPEVHVRWGMDAVGVLREAGSGEEVESRLPLIMGGEESGVLRLRQHKDTDRARSALKESVARQVSLSLTSLRLHETLRQQSIRDALTGLFNRRYFEETFERELRRAERQGHPISLLALDIDHFKTFNDAFGHDAGDAVLRSVASLLQTQFRKEDVVCRYGGEEFVVLLPNASREDAVVRAEEVRVGVEQLRLHHQGFPLGAVTLSVGLATYPQHAQSGEMLFKRADQALYCAKRAGRNRVVIAPEYDLDPAPVSAES